MKIRRIIQNTSGYDVVVRTYFKYGNPARLLEYAILNNEHHVIDGTFIVSTSDGMSADFEWIGNVDSVTVTFGVSKIQKHCLNPDSDSKCAPWERSIILSIPDRGFTENNGYVLVKDTNDTEEYLYTITPEDYENADDL